MAFNYDFGAVLLNHYLQKKKLEQEQTQFNQEQEFKNRNQSMMERYYNAQESNMQVDNELNAIKANNDMLNKARDDARNVYSGYTDVVPTKFQKDYGDSLIKGVLLKDKFKDYPELSNEINPEHLYARKSDIDEYYKGYNAETQRINAYKQSSGDNEKEINQVDVTDDLNTTITTGTESKSSKSTMKTLADENGLYNTIDNNFEDAEKFKGWLGGQKTYYKSYPTPEELKKNFKYAYQKGTFNKNDIASFYGFMRNYSVFRNNINKGK